MKNTRAWVALLLAFAFQQSAFGQSELLIDSVSLHEHLRTHDLETYFNNVNELGKKAYDNSDVPSLLKLADYLHTNFGTLTTKERLTLRGTAMRLANFHYKLEGYNADVLRLYLLAHENVSNKISLDSLAWFVENDLCIIYTIIGDYEKADYFGELLDRSLRRYGMIERLSRFYTNKGRLLKSAYKTEDAIMTFQKGYAYADSINFIGGMLSNALNLAEAFNENPTLGDPEYYLHIASGLLPVYKGEKSFPEKKASFEMEYGKFLIAAGETENGFAHLDSALQYLTEYYKSTRRREFSKYFQSLGEAFYSIDSLDAAIKAVDKGITSLMPEYSGHDESVIKNQLYADNSIAELFGLKARVFEQKYTITHNNDYLEKALQCLQLSLFVYDVLRDYIVADPSKLVAIRNNKEMVTKSIEILYQLYSEEFDAEYLAKARSLFNRSKSILYSEKILHAHLTTLLKPAEKDHLKSLQRKLLALYDQKLEINADITSLNGQILDVFEQVDSLYIPYQSLALQIKEPEDYIEYVVDNTNVYALSRNKGLQKFSRIGDTQDFINLVQRLEEFIALKDLSLDHQILNELYSFLLNPFGETVPEQLVVIPDGPVGFVPFELLKNVSDEYLIYHSTISYAFEYQTLESTLSKEGAVPDYIYCLSPVYPAKGAPHQTDTRGGLYHLPYAKQEIDTISKLFGENAMISESSLKSDWMNHIQACNIFHYAGHAIINGDKAFLALTADDLLSKQLTAAEITLLHLPLDLVVLSACETGLGTLEYGEGIRSLGRSFMEAGTASTIISLWNVSDKSTAWIMTAFYSHLKQGHKKNEALRNAKLDYLKNTSTRTKHPFYWAAFIPAGNMESL